MGLAPTMSLAPAAWQISAAALTSSIPPRKLGEARYTPLT